MSDRVEIDLPNGAVIRGDAIFVSEARPMDGLDYMEIRFAPLPVDAGHHDYVCVLVRLDPFSSTGKAAPIVRMSRAILGVITADGETLEHLEDEALREFSEITSAFAADFEQEIARRVALTAISEG